MSSEVPFHINAIAGGVGGMCQVVVGQPFDQIKSALQVGKPVSFKPAALYRGMSMPLLASSGLNMVLFSVTGLTRKLVSSSSSSPTLPEVVAAALLTAPVYVAFVTPVELVKVQLMTNSSIVGGPVSVIRSTIAQHGLRGLWRGYGATCGMRLVGLPFYFGANEMVKSKLSESRSLTKLDIMAAGSAAGAAFWFACYPLDSIKSVAQSCGIGPREAIDVILSKGKGILGFYRGLGVCLLRSMPANAVVFVTVDAIQNELRRD
jgi:hypothetical protein